MEELDQARLAIMRCVQREAFSQIYALSSGRDSSNLTKGIKAKDLQQNEDLRITQTLNPLREHVLIVVFGKQSLKRNKWEIYPLIVSIKPHRVRQFERT